MLAVGGLRSRSRLITLVRFCPSMILKGSKVSWWENHGLVGLNADNGVHIFHMSQELLGSPVMELNRLSSLVGMWMMKTTVNGSFTLAGLTKKSVLHMLLL
ncbi:hypothetical protein Tsubulata_043229 [Turnera subulata]|uniref:Uncharacterized protein n=1 Tax=Turnera subulata TaxID=218843 RepID=A0A9Q0J713_9ROSI|nr:hypothetical protein Tsubulata_043229 [Turnera subulata]